MNGTFQYHFLITLLGCFVTGLARREEDLLEENEFCLNRDDLFLTFPDLKARKLS